MQYWDLWRLQIYSQLQRFDVTLCSNLSTQVCDPECFMHFWFGRSHRKPPQRIFGHFVHLLINQNSFNSTSTCSYSWELFCVNTSKQSTRVIVQSLQRSEALLSSSFHYHKNQESKEVKLKFRSGWGESNGPIEIFQLLLNVEVRPFWFDTKLCLEENVLEH